MKKTLFTAVVLSCAAGASHADFSLYGLVDGSLGKSVADAQANERIGFHSGGDAGSGEGNSTTRIGIKGSTDVGSGIKANFKFETSGITGAGRVNGDNFFNRQAWFGLSGGFGEFRFGKQDSVPFQTFIDYDFNGASNGVSAACTAFCPFGLWFQNRQANSLQYFSPAMGAFKGQLGLKLKTSAEKAAGGKDVVSGGLAFAGSGLSVSGGFQTKDAAGQNDYFGIAGSAEVGPAKFTLGYHDQKTAKGIQAGAQVSFSGVTLGGIYAKETKASKGSAFELFVNKEVFKSTYAYAEIGMGDKKVVGGKGTGYAVGVIYSF